MRKNPRLVIELGSHTDSRGGDEFNLKLSKARAKSAVDYIVKNGIDPKRIKPVGYGETKHKIKDAQTEEEHQINRRTEFRIVDVKN
jgi:outer membrane protein OmpA-like peptidoglycan-associated protein